MSAPCVPCACEECVAWRSAHPAPGLARSVPAVPSAGDLHESLRSLVALLKRRDAYMTPEDQYALCRAETLLGLR